LIRHLLSGECIDPTINSGLFPNQKLENLVICVTGIGGRKNFSALMTDTIPNF
jgi:predicted helicase